MKLESDQLVPRQLLIHHHTNMKLFIAAAVILVVFTLEAQSVSVPGGREWRSAERIPRQQPFPQPIPQASQQSSQQLSPRTPPSPQPNTPQVLSASNPILLLVRVEAVTPQSSTPLRYEATYVARNRGAIHTAPLPGYSRSAASINVAPAPGTSW